MGAVRHTATFHPARNQERQQIIDKQKYPESLQTLAQDKYLRNLPKDPITGKADWEEVQNTSTGDSSDVSTSPTDPSENAAPGIYDVHSQASGKGLDGTEYKSW